MNDIPNNIVTCVYCGHEYPEGTPTSKHELLTAHIKVCEKHPMREAEAQIAQLREDAEALVEMLERVIGMHNPPHDCYVRGPYYGDARDFLCPSCEAVKMQSKFRAKYPKQKGGE